MELWESRASASKNIPDLPLGPHVREGWREAPGLRLGCSSTPWLPVPVSVLISVVFAGRTQPWDSISQTIRVPCENVSTARLLPGGSAPWLRTVLLSSASGQRELDHTGF